MDIINGVVNMETALIVIFSIIGYSIMAGLVSVLLEKYLMKSKDWSEVRVILTIFWPVSLVLIPVGIIVGIRKLFHLKTDL